MTTLSMMRRTLDNNVDDDEDDNDHDSYDDHDDHDDYHDDGHNFPSSVRICTEYIVRWRLERVMLRNTPRVF